MSKHYDDTRGYHKQLSHVTAGIFSVYHALISDPELAEQLYEIGEKANKLLHIMGRDIVEMENNE